MSLNIGRELEQLRNDPKMKWVFLAMKKVRNNVNQLGANVGADTTSLPAPSPPDSLQIKSSGTGLVHAVINDSGQVQRNVQYFVEYDTDPAFTQPHVAQLGSARTTLLRLPGKTDGGDAQSFYFRSFKQYPGSAGPSAPTVYGGTTPTPVAPGGSDTLTLLPSTGSGTAPNDGLLGGAGLGISLKRTLP